MGATLSNLVGQIVVEKLGHVASLIGSLSISVIPIVLFVLFMPETYGQRGKRHEEVEMQGEVSHYKSMEDGQMT